MVGSFLVSTSLVVWAGILLVHVHLFIGRDAECCNAISDQQMQQQHARNL